MGTKTEQSAYSKLSPKRRAFVDAYFACKFNGTQAAIDAGYSERTANEQAARLLANVSIKEAVEECKSKIEEQNKLKVSDVVEELKNIAFANITEAVNWQKNQMTLKDSKALQPAISASIASVTETPTKHGKKLSIKLHDKVKALELLGRYLNMFTDKMLLESSAPGLIINLSKPEKGTNEN